MKCRGCGKALGKVISKNDGLCEAAGNASCWSRCQQWGLAQNLQVWKLTTTKASFLDIMQLSPVLVDQWIERGCPTEFRAVLPPELMDLKKVKS